MKNQFLIEKTRPKGITPYSRTPPDSKEKVRIEVASVEKGKEREKPIILQKKVKSKKKTPVDKLFDPLKEMELTVKVRGWREMSYEEKKVKIMGRASRMLEKFNSQARGCGSPIKKCKRRNQVLC